MRTAKQLYHYLLLEGHNRPMVSIWSLALDVLDEYLPSVQMRANGTRLLFYSDLLRGCGPEVASLIPPNAFHEGRLMICANLSSDDRLRDGVSRLCRTRFMLKRHDRDRDAVCDGVTPLPVALKFLDRYRGRFCRLRQAFARYLEGRSPWVEK